MPNASSRGSRQPRRQLPISCCTCLIRAASPAALSAQSSAQSRQALSPSSQSALTSRSRARSESMEMSGRLMHRSHLLTAWGVIPSRPASSSWVMFLSWRQLDSRRPICINSFVVLFMFLPP